MAAKNILITGGAGFIGSHLCKRLLDEGCRVICVDNLFTGRRDNIKSLIKNKDFKLLKHDITEPLAIKVDQIYNLACPASPPKYQYDPIKTIKDSFLGSLNMLELAKKLNVPILQAQQVRSMVILKCTLKLKVTGEM